ncbi:hypothetical protein RD792_015639 [Penstemon davidsonii]|uniref:RING-type E3 ubiquitin transferase n=1 Tax=Penstemon davidsonii TaxID=160366 RepID=A0ABR0CIE5_9LAMI|nr:hypothetical protein RD792_015639 [Penstemon davidsonii]
MSSVANSNPWEPYGNYKDCSLGICSIYCPQFCYLIFPPPPSNDESTPPFSPLIIAIIGVLATAFLLVSYYTIVTRYCRNRNNNPNRAQVQQSQDPTAENQFQIGSSGLDEAVIKKIKVCKYKKGGDGLIEGTECAVCLSEFEENESLRLLSKCNHAFHLPCIDTWLQSHSNCPLCRAGVVALDCSVSSADQIDSCEIQELVLVVDDRDSEMEDIGNDQPRILISDILKTEENDEDLEEGSGSQKKRDQVSSRT